MTQTVSPLDYVVRPKGGLTVDDSVYIREQLDQISRSIHTLCLLAPQAATKAPNPPMETMIRYAKSPWWPVSGQSADAWVVYLNGTWEYLRNT